jgi:hypothetical protein
MWMFTKICSCAATVIFIATGLSAQAQDLPSRLISPSEARAACGSAPACAAWAQFRADHPTPYQAFAVSRRGDEAVIVIAEPPPSVGRQVLATQLTELFGEDLLEIGYFQLPTGLDGWLEDVVLRVKVPREPSVPVISGETLKPWEVPAGIADRLRLLAGVLWGTTDGFWIDEIEGDWEPATFAVAELRVPPSALHGWLTGSAPWRPLAAEGAGMTSATLLAATAPGAYGRDDGLVALAIPPRTNLAELESHFRRFAVASDLLLGSARKGTNGALILLGRARQIPLAKLPPLRFETFSRLAANRSDELAQSYERQRIFAGKIAIGEHKGWDWAPILLSSQLDDTDFGTLLNQADQVLKSWSEHGNIDYWGFAYPKPSKYPFDKVAASEYFEREFKTTSLLFNWNTNDFATLIRFPTMEILSVDRTGALPILYAPAKAVLDPIPIDGAETGESADSVEAMDVGRLEKAAQADARLRAAQARNHFASLGDPVLARVVQHVLLAQAVRSFAGAFPAAPAAPKARSDLVAAAIEGEAESWLTGVVNGRITVPEDLRTQMDGMIRSSGRTTAQFARLVASSQAIEREYEKSVGRYDDALRVAQARQAQALKRERVSGAEYDRLMRQITADQNAADVAEKEWKQICTSNRLKMVPTKTGTSCEAPPPAISARLSAIERRYATINERITQGLRRAKQINAAAATVDPEVSASRQAVAVAARKVNETVGLLNKIVELRQALEKYGASADLDRILASVRKAAASPPTSSVRTPPVVLSRNEKYSMAIGGHNIRLRPNQGRVVTGIGAPRVRVEGGSTVAEATATQVDSIPVLQSRSAASAPAATPLQPGRGTLLDEMRLQARGRAADPRVERETLAAAATCRCDMLVRRLDDGTILTVRNRPPPPSVRQVPVKSGLTDLLAGPPSPGDVEFRGFSTGFVESINDTVSRMATADARRTGGWGRAIDRLVRGAPGESGKPRILLVEREGSRDVLEAGMQPGVRTALASRVSARGARAEAATDAAWTSAFGTVGAQDGIRIIVRFPATPGGQALGIRIASSASALGSRILSRIQAWTLRRPAQESLGNVIGGLRETLRQEVGTGADIDFYFQEGADVIRVADGRSAPRRNAA